MFSKYMCTWFLKNGGHPWTIKSGLCQRSQLRFANKPSRWVQFEESQSTNSMFAIQKWTCGRYIYRRGNRELKARPKLKQNSGNFHARASQVCLAVDTRAELFSLFKLYIHLHDPPCFVTLSIHISYQSANLGKEAL